MKAQLVVVTADGPPHGSKATYDRHKCRCEHCRAANAAYMKRYRNKKSNEGII